ncbi:MAG: type 4a pilus biogenesis protein PilO [Gammaproteobacteria bacterium]|nr:type 4a pilus biogenesis protein PilO [Gammaproteobacteria bacterium]
MDLEQIKELDLKDVSRWPTPVKGAAVLILSAGVLGAGFWFDTREQLARLEQSKQQEQVLKEEFSSKQNKAANLESYKKQMTEMESSFGTMLRQLPSETEVAGLLSDISQTGLSNGLEFELFKPEAEAPAEFYSELPIKIKVVGTYHELGNFVSDVAALPRIVTLHNFTIKLGDVKGKGKDPLTMDAIAKTYRYLDESSKGAATTAAGGAAQ